MPQYFPTLSDMEQHLHTSAQPADLVALGVQLREEFSEQVTGEVASALNLNEDGTAWDDLNFPIIIRTTGTGIPTLETIIGNHKVPQWQVDDFVDCEGQELPHRWKQGSTLYWHIHLYTNGEEETDAYVAFELELAIANVGGELTTLTTVESGELEIPADTPTKTMLLFPLGTTDLEGYNIGAQIYARLKRVAAVGTAPAANPWVPQLQAHIELDGLGSREIAAK